MSSGPASSSYRGCSVPLGSPYCKQLGVSEQTAKIQCTFFLCVSDGKPRLNPPPPRVSIRASLLYRASRYKGRGENNLCIGVQTVTCRQHLGDCLSGLKLTVKLLFILKAGNKELV